MLHFNPKSPMRSKLSAARRFLPLSMIALIMALSSCESRQQIIYPDIGNTSGYIQNKTNILNCIKNGTFKIYSLNLGSTPIDKTIKPHQDKELRLYIHQGLSSGVNIDASAENGDLRIHLGIPAKCGKNIELIFPNFPSENSYVIQIGDDILGEIQQLLGIIRGCG